MPADPSNPENWSGEDKLSVVIETAALNEQELSEYCRKKGHLVNNSYKCLMFFVQKKRVFQIGQRS